MVGASDSIFAIGDCTATSYAPTAQVASQEGAYLARVLQQLVQLRSLRILSLCMLRKRTMPWSTIGYRQRKATVRLKESVLAHCSSTY